MVVVQLRVTEWYVVLQTDPWGMALPNGGSETPNQVLYSTLDYQVLSLSLFILYSLSISLFSIISLFSLLFSILFSSFLSLVACSQALHITFGSFSTPCLFVLVSGNRSLNLVAGFSF